MDDNKYNLLILNQFLESLERTSQLTFENHEKIMNLIEKVLKTKEENDIKRIAYQEGYESGFHFGQLGKQGY